MVPAIVIPDRAFVGVAGQKHRVARSGVAQHGAIVSGGCIRTC
jgi:hypothetical protein